MRDFLPTWLYHILDWPMNTGPEGSYNFWSGIGSGSPLFIAVAIWWRKHNCHIKRCPRLQWRPDPDDRDLILCRKHHPLDAPTMKK